MKPSGQASSEKPAPGSRYSTGGGADLWGDAEMAELCIGGAGPSQKPVLDKAPHRFRG